MTNRVCRMQKSAVLRMNVFNMVISSSRDGSTEKVTGHPKACSRLPGKQRQVALVTLAENRIEADD